MSQVSVFSYFSAPGPAVPRDNVLLPSRPAHFMFKSVAPQESAVERNEQTMMIVFSYYNFPCLLDIFLNSLLKLQGCRPQLEARANKGSLESAVIQIISDVYVTHIYVYM